MPYDADSANLPEHVRSLPEVRRRQWAAVWNSTYTRCIEAGGNERTCEASAFAQANGVLKRQQAAAAAESATAAESDAEQPGRPYLARLRELLRDLMRDGDLSEAEAERLAALVRSARGHAGAAARAARRQESAAFAEHTGLVVALWLDADTAGRLAVAAGEDAGDLHITLAYLGESDAEKAAAAHTAVGTWAARTDPLAGRISGLGRFLGSDAEGDPVYASVDLPDLARAREDLLHCLQAAGLDVARNHGFTPHITLAYVPTDAPSPVTTVPTLPLRFESVTVAAGGAHTAFRLNGHGPGALPAAYHEESEEADPPAAGGDLADLAATHRAAAEDGAPTADPPAYRLFMEAQFAEAPARVPYLPRPGTYKHPKWGTITVTAERLQRFVDNFAQGVYQRTVPLDAEHETKLSGAVAWVKRLVRNDQGGVDAEVEWTDRGHAFLAADRFKYISPEWYDEWTDPATGRSYRDVVIGGAITTRPFFKEGALRPLVASERGLEVTEGDSAPSEASAVTPPPSAPPMPGPAGEGDLSVSIQLTEEQARQFAEMEATLAKQAAELAEAKTAREAADAQARQLAERVARQEQDARLKRFTDEVTGRGPASGDAWPGDITTHVGFLEKLSQQFGEDSDEIRHYRELNRAHAEQLRVAGLFSEKGRAGTGTGSAGSDAWSQIEAKAKALIEADPKLGFAEAVEQVAKREPRLYSEYISGR